MKKFNPEKELRKIQKGNKNKVIFSIMLLLLIIAIGSSYALYQIRYSKQIIYTTVAPFYSKDIQISLYVDGEKDTTSDTFPTKDSGKIFSHVTCENGSSGVFDNTKWELDLKITKQDKCNVYFITGNLPNAPELYQGMIPVVYDEEGNIYVADTNKDWYNYQDHRWGNAVLVDASQSTIKDKYFNGTELKEDIAGTKIPMEEILQMYVWIPRYKYKIFSLGNTSTPKQVIEIAFEKGTETTGDVTCTYEISPGTVAENCPGIKKGLWYTHPAFTFKGTTETTGTELKGIWVGKFEPSDPTDPNGRLGNKINEITILPNKTSMILKRLSTMFFAERDIELKNAAKYNINADQIDTRVMKNIEWGAVAYLSQSVYGIYKDEQTCNIEGMEFKNCEIWKNNVAQGKNPPGASSNYGGTATGCVGISVSASVEWNPGADGDPAVCPEGRRWNESGVKASTTGNMYGIYDMAGGATEYVMGAMIKDGGTDIYLGISDFVATSGQSKSLPDKKYYDVYTYDANNNTHERGHYGDATKETLSNYGSNYGGWGGGFVSFLHLSEPEPASWFERGFYWNGTSSEVSIFSYTAQNGNNHEFLSFRSVLSAA